MKFDGVEFNAEGAEVFAEGRRVILPADQFQHLGLLPSGAISRILELGTRVSRDLDPSLAFAGSPPRPLR
jgi:hypothetical protein